MDEDFLDIARSLRHSRIRREVARALSRRRRAYLQQLADDVKTDAATVYAALHGAMPDYSIDASLVRLQIAKPGKRKDRDHYDITPFGDRIVANMADIVG